MHRRWRIFAGIRFAPLLLLAAASACHRRGRYVPALPPPGNGTEATPSTPLIIGETFTIYSQVLHETRRINVYLPAGYAESPNLRLPVLYMPDGGIAEVGLSSQRARVQVPVDVARTFALVFPKRAADS